MLVHFNPRGWSCLNSLPKHLDSFQLALASYSALNLLYVKVGNFSSINPSCQNTAFAKVLTIQTLEGMAEISRPQRDCRSLRKAEAMLPSFLPAAPASCFTCWRSCCACACISTCQAASTTISGCHLRANPLSPTRANLNASLMFLKMLHFPSASTAHVRGCSYIGTGMTSAGMPKTLYETNLKNPCYP